MATDANTLLEEAKCYGCTTDQLTLTLIQLGLLKQILLALDPGAMTDAETLLSDSEVKCYRCTSEQQRQLLALALLKQIADVIGGGGMSGVDCGPADPVAAPTSPCGVYINTTSGQIFWYFNGAWQ